MEDTYYLSRSRRIYTRFKIEAKGFLRVNKDTVVVILRDISSRGAGIVSQVPLKEESLVEIIGEIPLSNTPISKEGKVVWCSRIAEGLFYSGVDFGAQDKIAFS